MSEGHKIVEKNFDLVKVSCNIKKKIKVESIKYTFIWKLITIVRQRMGRVPGVISGDNLFSLIVTSMSHFVLFFSSFFFIDGMCYTTQRNDGLP